MGESGLAGGTGVVGAALSRRVHADHRTASCETLGKLSDGQPRRAGGNVIRSPSNACTIPPPIEVSTEVFVAKELLLIQSLDSNPQLQKGADRALIVGHVC